MNYKTIFVIGSYNNKHLLSILALNRHDGEDADSSAE